MLELVNMINKNFSYISAVESSLLVKYKGINFTIKIVSRLDVDPTYMAQVDIDIIHNGKTLIMLEGKSICFESVIKSNRVCKDMSGYFSFYYCLDNMDKVETLCKVKRTWGTAIAMAVRLSYLLLMSIYDKAFMVKQGGEFFYRITKLVLLETKDCDNSIIRSYAEFNKNNKERLVGYRLYTIKPIYSNSEVIIPKICQYDVSSSIFTKELPLIKLEKESCVYTDENTITPIIDIYNDYSSISTSDKCSTFELHSLDDLKEFEERCDISISYLEDFLCFC